MDRILNTIKHHIKCPFKGGRLIQVKLTKKRNMGLPQGGRGRLIEVAA